MQFSLFLIFALKGCYCIDNFKEWKIHLTQENFTANPKSRSPNTENLQLAENDLKLTAAVVAPPHGRVLKKDADVKLDISTGELVVIGGFSKEVWDYLSMYTNITIDKLVGAYNWGTANDKVNAENQLHSKNLLL